MRLSAGQIVDRARALFRQYSGTGSTWSDTNKETTLMVWLNNAYRMVLDLQPWDFLNREYEFDMISTQVSLSSAGATLSVDSVAGFYVGEQIYVTDGTNSERTTITALATGVMTVSPVLTSPWAVDATVGKIDYYLPRAVGRIKEIRRVGDYDALTHQSATTWDEKYLWQAQVGQPLYYSTHLNWDITEDLTSTAGTTTTSVIASTAPKQITNDDYNTWILQARDVSVTGWAIVSDYINATKTFALDRAITDMVTGKVFRLILDRPKLRFFPIPDSAYRLSVQYVYTPEDLINYYDYPEFGTEGERYTEVLAFLLAVAMARDIQNTDLEAELVAGANSLTQKMVNKILNRGRQSEGMVVNIG